MKDPPSREVLCEALCLFMELHDDIAPGSAQEFWTFVQDGCSEAQRFAWVAHTGEYYLYCKASLLEHRGWRVKRERRG